MARAKLKYRRIVLKLSGEAFGTAAGAGVDVGQARVVADRIAGVARMGVELAVVVGGGNLVRGRQFNGQIEQLAADHMGMLATVINGLILRDLLIKAGVPARLMTAIEMIPIAEFYTARECVEHLRQGRVTILAAGAGNPFFTTDTAAALRARELGAEALLKATNVDGVYSADPRIHPGAKKLERLSHGDVLAQDLKVMDAAAAAVCREGAIPIIVFNFARKGVLKDAVLGKSVGTIVE